MVSDSYIKGPNVGLRAVSSLLLVVLLRWQHFLSVGGAEDKVMGFGAAMVGGFSGLSIQLMANAIRKVPMSRRKFP